MHRLALVVLMALPAPQVFADTIEADGAIARVTLYPWGASVVREVRFDAAEGVHELIVPGLPLDTPAERLRVAAPDGVRVGSVNLARGRLPVTDTVERPEVAATRTEIERLEEVIQDHDRAIAVIRARITAADERVSFLRAVAERDGAEALGRSAEDLRALTRLVGEEVLAARQEALTADAEAEAQRELREEDVTALTQAKQALSALINEGAQNAVLTMSVGTTGGEQVVEVTTFTGAARWSPVYDLRLTQGDTDTLEIDRGVLVSQASGEDWRGVELTLSTARPADQSAPSQLWPWLRQIAPPQPRAAMRSSSVLGGAAGVASMDMVMVEEATPAPVLAPPVVEMQGATVTYRYPGAVDLRNGVEDLRLSLDTLGVEAELTAVAVPRQDETAFLVAEFTNDTGEVLLPGQATLVLDGAMVGLAALDLVAGGDTATLGFGAIDGVRLERRVPERSQGDRGVLTSSNAFEEVAVLTVENLTDRDWSLRVLDQVPYSEQDDLEVEWSATPRPTETDVDGLRGVLAWEFDLPAADTQEIRLEHSLEWPGDMELR